MTLRNVLLHLVAAALAVAGTASTALAQPAADEIHIGIARDFFHDVPPVIVDIAVEPFGMIMKQATGLNGKLLHRYDAYDIAHKIDTKELHLGVLHGHEFAWVLKKYPKLVPIMIAHNEPRDVRGHVIVHKNNAATSLQALRGKTLDIPEATKEHCRLYLNKACRDNVTPHAVAFFKAFKKSRSSIAALDDLCRGNVDAVLIDTITLDFYKAEKGPFFEKNLRILSTSNAFPPPVIVCKEGTLSIQTLDQLRKGLATADQTREGREFMKMWQIAAFEPVPATYTKSLADVIKEYPPPAPVTVGMR